MAKKSRVGVPLPAMEQVEGERRRIRHRRAYKKALKSTIYVLVVVAAAAILISSLLVPVLQITGGNMEPTLSDGDIVVLAGAVSLSPGDLCGFSWNNKTLIKRVIALPGQWVRIDEDGTVLVGDSPDRSAMTALDEPYLAEKTMGDCDIEFPYHVPEGCYFVLGDKRSIGADSRSTLIGAVDKERIIGRVFFRIYPLRAIGAVK